MIALTRTASAARRKTWSASGSLARMLMLSLHLLLGKLEPPRDLVDDVGVEEVGLEPVGKHATNARPSRTELPPDRDDRHGLIVGAKSSSFEGEQLFPTCGEVLAV